MAREQGWWTSRPGFPEHGPMLASPTSQTKARRAVDPRSLQGRFTYDVKLDGVRAIWVQHALNGAVRTVLINRNGVNITARYPEFAPVPLGGGPTFVLDGEIIATSGSFEDLALRDRQSNPDRIKAMVGQVPVRFVAFDILGRNELDLRSMEYQTRRAILDRAIPDEGVDLISKTVVSDDPGLLDLVTDMGMEGVIAKGHTSTYQTGRQQTWLKFKATHRVSCIPTGYEPGKGHRAHFGAMHLAMLGPDGPVNVGRVGTGFDDDTIHYLKKRLDAGDLFVVEIETLNRTKTNVLRFPSFKGVRSDLSPTDCTIDQLSTLPTC